MSISLEFLGMGMLKMRGYPYDCKQHPLRIWDRLWELSDMYMSDGQQKVKYPIVWDFPDIWKASWERKSEMCSSKNIHTPRRGHFCFKFPPRISISRGACNIPPSPMNFCNFLNWLDTPGKNTFLKNAVALYLYAIDSGFCDKERKNLFYLC